MDEPTTETPPADDALEQFLVFLAETRAIDLSGYKRSSLARRIHKRMDDIGVKDYDDYRDVLEANADEFRFLFDTILINVTSFFRDPGAWELLRSEVIPLVVDRAGADEVRVWSAGCSSGEEAYSLAIAFAEAMGVETFRDQVKIYATDIDDNALRDARHGVYTAKALESLSADLVERYFEPAGASFSFLPDLRRRVIFGRHDLARDAPISRLHLLSCRNTLMYFNSEAQSRIIDRFHFSLADHGFLLLGKAEMLLANGERFETFNMANRVFRRRAGIRGYQPVPTPVLPDQPPTSQDARRRRQLRDVALDVSPIAHVLVDLNGTVVMANNQARAMFGLTSRDEGRPLRDLEISYRPAELRSLVEQAQAERRTARLTAVERPLGPDSTQFIDVQVQPLISDDGVVLGVDISFTDTTALVRLQEDVTQTRDDVETAYEELQSTNEELETTNEELQSSIEELETTNEELQSTNEELETTNEELQSTNEELETMNEELRSRTSELDETGRFLDALVGTVPIGLVVLDRSLTVLSWNDATEQLWGLRGDEAEDRPFFTLDFGLPTATLREPVRACLDDGTSAQVDIESVNRLGRHVTCTVHVSPMGEDHNGVVLTMEDRRPS